MSRLKLAASSRTNLTVATTIAGAIAIAVARRAGFDLEVALAEHDLAIAEVMAALMTAAGSAAIYFRERGRIRDEQGKVTARPK